MKNEHEKSQKKHFLKMIFSDHDIQYYGLYCMCTALRWPKNKIEFIPLEGKCFALLVSLSLLVSCSCRVIQGPKLLYGGEHAEHVHHDLTTYRDWLTLFACVLRLLLCFAIFDVSES